jgi:arabinogalactan endo-1,4-beta-galactosidase
MNVLVIIDYTPGWARASGCNSPQCPPANPNDYATFAATVVNRYAPKGVHAYEVWNEPNNAFFWQPSADATAYTNLLKAAYPAIKGADSQATVLMGGTAPESTDGTNISRRDFLQRMYAAGAKGYFDAVSDHPYTFPRLPADNTDRAWSEMSTTANSLRSTMIANGDSGKKIWITEFGAPTGGPGATATPANSETISGAWHVDETLQANILKEAIRLYKGYDWVGPFFWYSNKDSGTSQSSNENFFGLVRADGSHKPGYDAYSQAIR